VCIFNLNSFILNQSCQCNFFLDLTLVSSQTDIFSGMFLQLFFVQVKIIGVEPSDANAMALSLYHGKRVMLEHVGGFADGVAVKAVGEETFRLCRELVDGIVMVSRDAICASIKVRTIHVDVLLNIFFL
jgi:hypothetical protein